MRTHLAAHTLVVLAKAPRAGHVKTRLTPPFTPAQAALLASASLADTLDAVSAAPARRRLLVLDGPADGWRRPGFEVVAQSGGGLDERLAHAFSLTDGPVLLVGMDTPQLTPALLRGGSSYADAWFGPAADGGFWALGFRRRPRPEWLLGIPMSRPDTGAAQRARLVAAGLRVSDLPILTDVDTANDAHLVAETAPHGRFAATLRSLLPARAAVEVGVP